MEAVLAVLKDPPAYVGGPPLSAHTAVCVLQWGFSGSRVSRILLPLFSSYKTHPPPPPPYSIQPFAVSFHPPSAQPIRYASLPCYAALRTTGQARRDHTAAFGVILAYFIYVGFTPGSHEPKPRVTSLAVQDASVGSACPDLHGQLLSNTQRRYHARDTDEHCRCSVCVWPKVGMSPNCDFTAEAPNLNGVTAFPREPPNYAGSPQRTRTTVRTGGKARANHARGA